MNTVLLYLAPQKSEFLDIEGVFSLIECQSSLADTLQDGAESLVVLLSSGAPNEIVARVAHYDF